MSPKFKMMTAVACGLVLAIGSTVSAQQETRPNERDNQQGMQDGWVEQLSQTVNLSDEQKSEIRQTVQQHNQKIRSAYQQFGQAHLKAIGLEAQLYSAIEDNMDPRQQSQFRQNQERGGNSNAMNDRSANADDTMSAEEKRTRETQYRDDRPAEDRDEASESSSNEQAEWTQSDRGRGDESRTPANGNTDDDTAEMYVTTMILVPAKHAYTSTGLDEEQRGQCEMACQKFKTKLTQAWSEVQQHHQKLVKLEAAKIQAVEDVLDEEQLQTLRNSQSETNDSGNWSSEDRNSSDRNDDDR